MKGTKHWIYCCLLFLMIIFCMPMMSLAKTKNGQTVYSSKTVEKRIKVIQDYYYNKNGKLKVVKNKCNSTFDYKDFSMEWYYNGSDLLFAYGSNGTYQLRLYYYKNQLIRMLVDQKGYSRKTYTQKYDDWCYMMWNLKGTIQVGNRTSVEKASPKSGDLVLVTAITKTSITYYKLKSTGPDGCIWYTKPVRYKASLADGVKIYETPDPCDPSVKISYSTFKKYVKGSDIGTSVFLTCKNGKVSKMEIPYWP